MTGTIVQINISRGGIPKLPVPAAFIGPLGLEGDAHARPEIHGGPLKAVLMLCAETVEDLAARGYPVFFGALGENLTVRGLDRGQFREGQQFRAGEAILELTRLRVPCSALDVYGPSLRHELYDERAKEGDTTSPRWAMGGFYARVIRPGTARRDDIISLVAVMA